MGYIPYTPQNDPVPAGRGVWTIEGPTVPYKVGPVAIPCPTRSTLLADPEGGIWIHSPIAFSPDLLGAVRRLGPVAGLIAPNTFHHLHLAQWAEAVPDAACLVAPRLEAKLGRIDPERLAEADSHPALAGWLDGVRVDGGAWCELVFHHRASGTLVATDLIQNFELDRVSGAVSRILLRLAGAGRGPVLSSEMLAMAFFAGRGRSVRDALASVGALSADRLLIAHGAQPRDGAWSRLLRSRRSRPPRSRRASGGR